MLRHDAERFEETREEHAGLREAGTTLRYAPHYLGLVRGIPREARTLEAAMQIEELMAKMTARPREQVPTVRAAPAT